MKNLEKIKEEFSWACRLIYARGLVAGSGGNLSLRTGDLILLTPSGYSLRDITPDLIISINAKGEITPDLKPSIEANLHLQVLEKRKDINVVCHVHGPNIIAATLFFEPGNSTIPPITPSFSYSAYPLPMIPYITPGTQTLSDETTKIFSNKKTKALLLQNHGLVVVGNDLREAINISEDVEEAAHIFLLSKGMGKFLSKRQVEEIKKGL